MRGESLERERTDPSWRRYSGMRNVAWGSSAVLLGFMALYAGWVESRMEAGPPPAPQPVTPADAVGTIAYLVLPAWLLVGFVPPLMRLAGAAAVVTVGVYEVLYQSGLTGASPGFDDGNIVWIGLIPAALLMWAAHLPRPSQRREVDSAASGGMEVGSHVVNGLEDLTER